MKVVIPGGAGQIGAVLRRGLARAGHEVVVLSRNPRQDEAYWDGETLGSWVGELEGAGAVINLAGRSVNCRYNAENRRAIMHSRVASTAAVGRAIAGCTDPPPVWLQASTATIYAHRYDGPNDEYSGILGGDEPGVPDTWRFSIDVARAWERELAAAVTPRTRKVAMRSAMVMSPDRGGVFDVLLGLVRHGLGGTSGNGRQYVSATRGAHASVCLRRARCSRSARSSSWTETELVLKSRRVVPARLAETGFQFRHPAWPAAARDLCGDWAAADK